MKFIKIFYIVLTYQLFIFSQDTTLHKYKLIVQDVNGNLINKKKITYVVMSDIFITKKIIKKGEIITSENGEAIITAEIPIDWELAYDPMVNRINEGRPQYTSMLLYEIKDSVHYPIVGNLKSFYGGLSSYSPRYYESKDEWYDLTSKEYQINTLILASSNDYFSKNFSKLNYGKKYRKNLEKLLDHLIINKIPESLNLKYGSISLVQFKKQSLFSFSFECKSVYNSNRLNEYDIVKKLLDENIYSLIKVINDFLPFDKNKVGLCINVDFYSKNFLEENTNSKKYKVRYYFFNDLLKKYLLKDISRQELLSKSVILLNDDKIDIK